MNGRGIPASSKKLVAELKAVVDFSEVEIYAMLRECNMDPNEAVHRLLSQDSFHEVKNKKDKKKETKEPSESRSRGVNSSSSRGTKVGKERVGRGTVSQYNSADYGVGRGKTLKKESNDTRVVLTSSIWDSNVVANNPTLKSTIPNLSSLETKAHPPNLPDGLSSSLQPSSGFQNNWLGKPGLVSMADIVKMGRPQAKSLSLPVMVSEKSFMAQNAAVMQDLGANKSLATFQDPEIDKNTYPEESISQVSESNHEHGITAGQHSSYDGWTLVDEPSATGLTTIDKFEVPMDNAEPVHMTSSLVAEGISSPVNIQFQDMQSPEDDFDSKSISTESRPASTSDRVTLDDRSLNSASSYLSPRQKFDHHEGSSPVDNVGVASAATEFQHLSLCEEVTSRKSVEAYRAVIIPDHLQVTNADCAHLSFGSFESGTFAGSFPSKSLKSDVEVATVTDASSPIEKLDVRNNYYNDEQLTASLNGIVATSRTDTDAEPLEVPSASQPELTRNYAMDTRYSVSSVSSYTDLSTIQPNTGVYMYPQGNVQMQNLPPYSSLMQPNTLQSNLLTPSLPPLRDLDLSLAPSLTAQALSTKYNTTVSSIGGSTVSLQEATMAEVFANPQSSQNLSSTNSSSTTSALPQHLPMHHYSQPALPLSHYANMIGYPFLPQSYTYLPSPAFQQAYAGSGPFHQSPAGLHNMSMKYLLPQYKSNASLSQSATIASVYGALGNSTVTPGSFNANPAPAAPANSTIGFGEALSLQYKEGSQYMPLQQPENHVMWGGHDAGSRTLSALPGSTFYNYQAQNQQSILRPSQQPSHLGNMGYPNFYNSQAGASQEHQHNSNEGNLIGSQNAQAQSAHQLWQPSYLSH